MSKEYKFYGTISYSGYVVVKARDEMEARQRAVHNQFSRIEVPTLDRHMDFIWDNEDPEELEKSKED